jgi:hypothetical protein
MTEISPEREMIHDLKNKIMIGTSKIRKIRKMVESGNLSADELTMIAEDLKKNLDTMNQILTERSEIIQSDLVAQA